MPRYRHSHRHTGNAVVLLLELIILLFRLAFLLLPFIVDFIRSITNDSKQDAVSDNSIPSSYGQAMVYLPPQPVVSQQGGLLLSEQVDLTDPYHPPLPPPEPTAVTGNPFAQLEQEIESLKQQISAMVFQTTYAFQVFRACWREILEQPLSILEKTWEVHVQNNIKFYPEEAGNLKNLEDLFKQLKGKYKENPDYVRKLRSDDLQEEKRTNELWKAELAAATERDKRSGGVLSILAETREGNGLQYRR